MAGKNRDAQTLSRHQWDGTESAAEVKAAAKRFASMGGQTGAGGRARFAAMTPAERSALAKKAAAARWSKRKP